MIKIKLRGPLSFKLSIDCPPCERTWREGVSVWGYVADHLVTGQRVLSFRLSKAHPGKRPENPTLTRFFLTNLDARNALFDLQTVMISLDDSHHPREFLGFHLGDVWDDPFMKLAKDKIAYALGRE